MHSLINIVHFTVSWFKNFICEQCHLIFFTEWSILQTAWLSSPWGSSWLPTPSYHPALHPHCSIPSLPFPVLLSWVSSSLTWISAQTTCSPTLSKIFTTSAQQSWGVCEILSLSYVSILNKLPLDSWQICGLCMAPNLHAPALLILVTSSATPLPSLSTF